MMNNKWQAKKNLNMQRAPGAVGVGGPISAAPTKSPVPNYGAGMAPNIKKIGGQVQKAVAGGAGAPNNKRNYDKPWLVPENSKKEP